MKKLIFALILLLVLAFVFADSLFYLSGRWQEKTGKVKKALETYSRLIKKYPRSRFKDAAEEAIKRLETVAEGKTKAEIISAPERETPYIGTLNKTKKKIKNIEEETNKKYEALLDEAWK